MATTAARSPRPPLSFSRDAPTRNRRSSSSSYSAREPRAVRSILLSAATHSPHAAATTAPEPAPVATASQSLRQGEHPPGRSETAASDDTGPSWESGRPNGAHIAVASPVQDDGPDGRPPSIYLNEQLDVDVEADTTTCDSGIIAPYSSPDPTPTPASASSSMPRPASATVNVSVLSAPRARRMTLDLPSSPIDVLYASDHKLALEGTSPKPCIVPGNALHLIDDDPAAPRSMTPPSIIIVGDESEHGLEPDLDGADDHHDHDHHGGEAGEGEPGGGYHRSGSEPPHECARPVPRVRFRSRVRITSGVHRHRHSHSHSHSATTGGGTSTPGSSTEDSPSSSISAPLRYQADDNTAWGPIGKRLSGYAGGGSLRRSQVGHGQGALGNGGPMNGGGGGGGAGLRGGARGYTERTPLLRPSPRRTYSESEDEGSEGMGEGERVARAAALRREEEAVFGKWPLRMFNRHWWWWHLEPVLCCCCADEDDYEEF